MQLLLRGRVAAIAFLLAIAFAFPATSPVDSQSKEALAFAVIGDSGTGQAPHYLKLGSNGGALDHAAINKAK